MLIAVRDRNYPIRPVAINVNLRRKILEFVILIRRISGGEESVTSKFTVDIDSSLRYASFRMTLNFLS